MSQSGTAIKATEHQEQKPAPALNRLIGRIVAASGAQAIVMLDPQRGGAVDNFSAPEMGSLVKIQTSSGVAMGIVSAVSIPAPAESLEEKEIRIAELELVGELEYSSDGRPIRFRRGITTFPSLSDNVFTAERTDLECVFGYDPEFDVRIGTLHQDPSIPAYVLTDELLSKHLAILGTTGTGKSCVVALLLRALLKKYTKAHILLLDPHNEYRPCFGDTAEYIGPETLRLPYWLLNFDELIEVLVGSEADRETETEILREIIPLAKTAYRSSESGGPRAALLRKPGPADQVSVDTPKPYRLSDVISLLNQTMGKLDRPENLAPYRRLKTRIEALTADPRYSFMFGSLTVTDDMTKILGQLFRIPVNGRPISLIDLSGIPSEILNVVVSVLCRLAFDLALWSNGSVPITIVCEEAHRYAPRDDSLGFEPTKRALSRIAKEGRKYGVSLCLVTQRPSELASTILSQCNTIFTLRLTNEKDQAFVRAATADAAPSLLQFLPTMGNGEALAFGEGVTLPMRIVFDTLPDDCLPSGGHGQFSEKWNKDIDDEDFLEELVHRWRHQARE
ncbi:MAG: DUF87 domain-containing protein [Alphaproteobacteria bacterium]|nr:MAG: DUF87 domain-containing protein [Alphaproteobacteria bacterium]